MLNIRNFLQSPGGHGHHSIVLLAKALRKELDLDTWVLVRKKHPICGIDQRIKPSISGHQMKITRKDQWPKSNGQNWILIKKIFFCCCCLLDHRRSWESERDIESDSGSHHNVGAPAKETTLRCERRGKMTGAMYSGNYMLAF